mmetsp:Transcript_3039/g.4866  ORF Transcript_3039/g.4866 Transcript_3039/m.4866 type:complete len:225 (-) Transcript_3039:385-1059(-)
MAPRQAVKGRRRCIFGGGFCFLAFSEDQVSQAEGCEQGSNSRCAQHDISCRQQLGRLLETAGLGVRKVGPLPPPGGRGQRRVGSRLRHRVERAQQVLGLEPRLHGPALEGALAQRQAGRHGRRLGAQRHEPCVPNVTADVGDWCHPFSSENFSHFFFGCITWDLSQNDGVSFSLEVRFDRIFSNYTDFGPLKCSSDYIRFSCECSYFCKLCNNCNWDLHIGIHF